MLSTGKPHSSRAAIRPFHRKSELPRIWREFEGKSAEAHGADTPLAATAPPTPLYSKSATVRARRLCTRVSQSPLAQGG